MCMQRSPATGFKKPQNHLCLAVWLQFIFSFIFQLPFYTLVFSEWGCFFNSLRFFNPSVLWALPLYDFATPRNAAGHGKGRGLNA